MVMQTAEAVVTGLSLLAVIIATIVGNILVILSVFTYKPLHKAHNMFIASLSVVDVAVAIFVMPFQLYDYIMETWELGLRMCEMWLTLYVWFFTATNFNLCAIALDRYLAVNYPIKYALNISMKKVLFVMLLLLVLSFLISVPPIFTWNNWADTFTNDNHCSLEPLQGYIIYYTICVFCLPLITIISAYVKIFQVIRRQLAEKPIFQREVASTNQGGKNETGNVPMKKVDIMTRLARIASDAVDAVESNSSTRNTSLNSLSGPINNDSQGASDDQDSPEFCEATTKDKSTEDTSDGKTNSETSVARTLQEHENQKKKISLSKQRRAAKTMVIIVGVFIVCWSPFFILYIFLYRCEKCNISAYTIQFINWLGYSNSAINPVIYTIFNQDFRKAFRRLLCKRQ